MGVGGRKFKLELPIHIRDALSNIYSLKKEVDLIVNVYDSRSPRTSDVYNSLLDIFPGIEILNIASKSDLSGIKKPNCFDFKNQKNRGKILDLIKKALKEKDDMYRKRGYVSHFQILVIGLPNVGKSTLINLLKGKKIAVSENRPGVTRKVVRHYLGDNLWLYDSPGIFMYDRGLEGDIFDKLFLINAIPANINDYSEILERTFYYLLKHYPKEIYALVGREDIGDYSVFMEEFARRFNFKYRDGEFDMERAESKFLSFLRDGRIKIFWDLDGI